MYDFEEIEFQNLSNRYILWNLVNSEVGRYE